MLELKSSIEANGMKFFASNHRAEHYFFLNGARASCPDKFFYYLPVISICTISLHPMIKTRVKFQVHTPCYIMLKYNS